MSSFLNTEALLPYLVRLMIILLINPLHECAHALAAYKLGDNTARDRGRLTLDPISHIDPIGALLLLFFGFGWAKPVPVNPNNFKNKSRDMMLTAIAGPASNLAAALIGILLLQLFGFYDNGGFMISGLSTTMTYVFWIIYYFISINLNLCIFNMIPVPPLDGSRVLSYLLPPKGALFLMRNQRYFYGIVMLLMMTGILTTPLVLLNRLIFNGLLFVTDCIPAVLG